MINYLIINVMLSFSALAINHFMNIPHRVRFHMLMIAVIGWMMPFSMITIELSQQTMKMLPIQTLQISQQQTVVATYVQSNFNWLAVFSCLLLIGLVRFVIDLISTSKSITRLKPQSKPYKKNQNIRFTNGVNGAFVSGLFNPIIWIDEHLEQSETLNTIMTHEQQHIQSHDQIWLFIITLVQRLFWFNPLTYYLCHKTRHSIEFSCDEACKVQLGHRQYQSHLAQITMIQHQAKQIWLNNQVNQDASFNIKRIKQLDQENNMNRLKTTQLSLISLLVLAMSLYSFTTVAKDENIGELKDNEVLLSISWKINGYRAGLSRTMELNSEIVVNDQEYKSYELMDTEIKVKAQLTNPGFEPKIYFIETQITGNADFPVNEPKLLVEHGKKSIIRIADTESDLPETPLIELAFTVLTESQLAKK